MRLLKIVLFCLIGLFDTAYASFSAHLSQQNFSNSPHLQTSLRGVNIVGGNYTFKNIDLEISGPDPLAFTRLYNSNDQAGNFGIGWQIFPEMYFVIGQNSEGQRCAKVIDRTGELFSYVEEGEFFKIDLEKIGMLQATTVSSKNQLMPKKNGYELIMANGAKRFYEEVDEILDFFGEKINLGEAGNSKTYRLVHEQLPSGNVKLFHFENNRLVLVEHKDSLQKKLHAFIRFTYEGQNDQRSIIVTTSDKRTVKYHFHHEPNTDRFLLTRLSGAHCIPISYEYEFNNERTHLKKKKLPEGRFEEFEYDQLGRVEVYCSPLRECSFFRSRLDYLT